MANIKQEIIMLDRRNYLKTSAVAVNAIIVSGTTTAQTGATDNKQAEGNSSSYRLPVFKKGSRLLFQGDSITDMNWGRNEKDRNHYLGHSYVYLIAARLGVDMPEAKLDIYNRGMSGHTVGDLRKRWGKDAIAMLPDLLSILIGTNDVGRGVKPIDFESDYRFILEASRKANKELRIVLVDPFVLPTGGLSKNESWSSRRTATDELRMIVSKLAKDFDAVHVKAQDVFDDASKKVAPEQWIWDGIHPLPQGHELIARNWLQEVSARWH
jgi:lysophospholipase L1-like esterase